MSNNRLTIIDCIRGFALINMIIYHLLWDLVYIYDVNIDWYDKMPGTIWQFCICFTFIILSGFCFHLGKHKVKRALYIIGGAVIISLVTYIVMPQDKILFGILWFMGTAMLIMILLDKVLIKVSSLMGIFISFFMFILTKNIGGGRICFFKWDIFELPQWLYSNLITAYLGFPPMDFSSADYFPIIPWIWIYIMGYFIYLYCKKKDLLKYFSGYNVRFLQWLGKHTLLIYMVHQVVIYGVLYVVFRVF